MEMGMMPDQASLAGIRVLDLSQYLPGPFTAQILADLGAEVVKVEPPAGEPMRRLLTVGSDGVSFFYRHLNAGKTVVRLDLKTEEDREIMNRLLKQADVLMESFRPGVLERQGFDRKSLEKINPRLIHCALSGFGQTGPYRLRGGHDLTYAALTGGLSATGTEAEPAIIFPPMADHAGAQQAVIAILSALLGRSSTGKGRFLDVSIFETVLSWQSLGLIASGCDPGQTERGHGLLTGGAAYYHIYRTADGRFMALGAIEPKFWAAFCEAVGREDWTRRQWETLPQTNLIKGLENLFGSRSFRQWCELAARVDCCLEPVLEHSEVADHPQVRERGLVNLRPGQEPQVDVRFPMWTNDSPPPPRTPLKETSALDVLAGWETSEI